MRKIFIVGLMLLFAGCAAQQKISICNQVPEGERSVLCQASYRLNVSLETIATALKVGNVAGLAGDLYLAQDAVDFIDRVDVLVQKAEGQGASYAIFIGVVKTVFGDLPPEVQALFVVAEEYVKVAIPEISDYFLTPYDYKLLRLHLERQRQLVAPFLIGG